MPATTEGTGFLGFRGVWGRASSPFDKRFLFRMHKRQQIEKGGGSDTETNEKVEKIPLLRKTDSSKSIKALGQLHRDKE